MEQNGQRHVQFLVGYGVGIVALQFKDPVQALHLPPHEALKLAARITECAHSALDEERINLENVAKSGRN